MPFHLKDDFKAGDKCFTIPANWYNQVARFLNTLTIRNGGVYKPVFPSDTDPVELIMPETEPPLTTPAAPEDPTILGGDGEGGPLGEGADDDALTDDYDPEDADQDGLSLWVITRIRYDHTADPAILYAYTRKLTWPKSHAPVVGAETRFVIDEPEAPV